MAPLQRLIACPPTHPRGNMSRYQVPLSKGEVGTAIDLESWIGKIARIVALPSYISWHCIGMGWTVCSNIRLQLPFILWSNWHLGKALGWQFAKKEEKNILKSIYKAVATDCCKLHAVRNRCWAMGRSIATTGQSHPPPKSIQI